MAVPRLRKMDAKLSRKVHISPTWQPFILYCNLSQNSAAKQVLDSSEKNLGGTGMHHHAGKKQNPPSRKRPLLPKSIEPGQITCIEMDIITV